MAYVDLLLNMDDELAARLRARVQKDGVSLERWLGDFLAQTVEYTYSPPDESQQSEPRSVIHVDLTM